MKSYRLVAVSLFLLVASQATYANSKWEYKAKTVPLFQDDVVSSSLNSTAKEGWELVNCTSKSGGELICIFKRPKP